MPQKRIYLYVPFKDKEKAKSLGAMWDDKEKKWFAPKTLDKNIFSQWLYPHQNKEFSFGENEVLTAFKSALENQGLIIEGLPIMDGKIHRVKTTNDKGRELSGAYNGFLDDYPAGFMQNFKTGIKENWKMPIEKNQSNNIKNSQKLHEQIKKDQELREKEILTLQEKTALKLENEYNNARWANSNHAYLKKKGFDENFYLKQDNKGSLLIPLKDENGKLWSVQRIFPNGDKIIGVIKTQEEKDQGVEYLAKKQGCFHIIGAKSLEHCKEFIITEGFATAATIYKALNKPVIMGVDAGNLSKIVETLKNKFQNTPITLIADNDKKRELKGLSNVGVETAKEIQQKFSDIKVIIPKISNQEAEQGISDFNDIFLNKGIDEVKKQLNFIDFHNKLKSFKSMEKTQPEKEITR
ncbi:TPA: toprim domain-containing protein [Campylobacter jejuni]|nr:toprim domain-containing protein [Campylobacter jejuni]HED0615939.1 toprim domain-containing protein [Campylobacter jejuni]HED0650485.1 toprim domain-containing protein [Campylobacter jejuni]HED0650810.1 toprim domain-containing protein [Campylobacter jejuni]HED0890798.1 toprim domain-containing protein [Campylobacter jejuni]